MRAGQSDMHAPRPWRNPTGLRRRSLCLGTLCLGFSTRGTICQPWTETHLFFTISLGSAREWWEGGGPRSS
ncbi:unnamed protein product [Parajaminaea phylloscopi]